MTDSTTRLVETMNALIRVGEYRLAWRCFVLNHKQMRLTAAKERHNRKVDETLKMAQQLQLEIESMKFKKVF